MANMIQCDKCGAVNSLYETYFVKGYRYSEPSKGDFKDFIDLCGNCYAELLERCDPVPANLGETTEAVAPTMESTYSRHNYG